jgi:alpha-D-ribose 1-methylphosphonate 5-triphosphate synthase subunit PhnG
MNRKDRTEILIKGNKNLAMRLADIIRKAYQVNIIEKPSHSLVMVECRETAHKSRFYLGEVYVSDCKVMINKKVGIGICKGHDLTLAYNLAIIDAAFNNNLPETEKWEIELLAEKKKVIEKEAAINEKILKTKVNFETMMV